MNFSNRRYLDILKSQEKNNINGDCCELTSSDAFMLLIKGVSKQDLENLCEQLQLYFKNKSISIELTEDECYRILQGEAVGPIEVDEKIKCDILEQAYMLADSGKYMGNNSVANGKINTSSWISHSLYVAKFSETIATELKEKQKMAIDVDRIKAAALLHDYGRKFDHTMGHVTKGAEALIDQGYPIAAVTTVTHSFFAGKRCANNEPAEPGFYTDESGKECWSKDEIPDDIREYLETHKLTTSDLIINLGDLVATDRGIVKLSDRLEDIKTRRTIDPKNREYFLFQVINGMTYMLEQVGETVSEDLLENMPKFGDGIEKAEDKIVQISGVLYDYTKRAIEEQGKSKKARIH